MAVDFQSLKSCLGNWKDVSIYYIDDEGSEIPIDSDLEFQEALRIGKSREKNFLNIILKSSGLKVDKMHSIGLKCSNTRIPNFLHVTNENENFEVDENLINKCRCECNHGSPPMWFSHQMKKFKKNLLEEIKCSINETVHIAFKKEVESLKSKLESPEEIHSLSNASVKRGKSSNKLSTLATLEQKESRLMKKFEKIHLTKLEKLNSRLEKLYHKTRLMVDERRNHYLKSKNEKKSQASSIRSLNSGKLMSAAFESKDTKMELHPGQELSISLAVNNNGRRSWKCPKLVCLAMEGISLDLAYFDISRMEPGDRCVIILSGKVSDQVGVYQLKCRMYDELKELCNPILYTIKVVDARVDSVEPKEKEDSRTNIIFSSQKKIERNICEIEKRLQNINSHRSPPCPWNGRSERRAESKTEGMGNSDLDFGKETPVKREEIAKHKIIQDSPKFERISEKNARERKKEEIEVESNLKEEIEKDSKNCDGKYFSDALFEGVQGNSVEDQYERLDIVRGEESESDSELSILYISEEEDNFIVIPMQSESPYPEDDDDYDCDVRKVKEESEEPRGATIKKEPTTIGLSKEVPEESDSTREEKINVEEVIFVEAEKNGEKINQNDQRFMCKSKSSFAEDAYEFESRRIRLLKSSEYHLTSGSLTQPSLAIRPNGSKGSEANCYPKGKVEEARCKGNTSDSVKSGKSKFHPINGKVIFAVNSRGLCVPVEEGWQDGSETDNSNNETSNSKTRQENKKSDKMNQTPFESPSETFSKPSVNILPDMFVSGASNMATFTISTSKSVINNLKSVFEGRRKSESQLPEEPKEPSREAMSKLFEMGFKNLMTNRNLLLAYENDLSLVLEELISLGRENHPNQP